MGRESGLRQRIRRALLADGWLVIGLPAGMYTGPGRPDLLVIVRGRAVFLEVKTADGAPSATQLVWQRRLREHLAYAYIVRDIGGARSACRIALEGVQNPHDPRLEL